MTCNCDTHRVETVNVTAENVILTVTDSTNISSLDCFNFTACGCIGDKVTGAPLPVLVNVNGVNVALYNKYSLPIVSDRVPRRSRGAYVVPASGDPYVILFDTPPCRCFA